MCKSDTTASNEGTSALRPMLTRQDTEQFLSYYQSSLADKGPAQRTPSPEATPARPFHRRELSSGSASSSEYSSDSSFSEYSSKDADSVSPPSVRRTRIPSEGGSDRRRLVIVQMDTVDEHGSKTPSEQLRSGHVGPSNKIRTRRGVEANLGDLALIAPPDAAPNSYAIPPATAPIAGGMSAHQDEHLQGKGHHRSASEALVKNTSAPRMVSIVGTSRPALVLDTPTHTPLTDDEMALHPPVFMHPQSRVSSPSKSAAVSPDSTYSHFLADHAQAVGTPMIGEGKSVFAPVAPPVTVNLGSRDILQVGGAMHTPPAGGRTPPLIVVQPLTPTSSHSHHSHHSQTSSYVDYQPGVHATAGPLPPPPRAAFNIDIHSPPPPRPPRLNSPSPMRRKGDMEAVKQALQLPPSVSAALAAKASPTSSQNSSYSKASTSHHAPKIDGLPNLHSYNSDSAAPSHRREGAFAPSNEGSPDIPAPPASAPPTSVTSNADPLRASLDTLITHLEEHGNDIRSIIVEPPPRNQSLGHALNEGEDSWVTVGRDITSSPEGRTSAEGRPSTELSMSISSRSASSQGAPSPPPKSFRHSLTNGFKRMSLQRTPSYKSLSRSSTGQWRSRTPSPSVLPTMLPPLTRTMPTPSPLPSPAPPRPKIISLVPDAMFCHEVHSLRSAHERCLIYAQKLNDLYMYDCGLADWVIAAKIRGSNNASRSTVNITPSMPSTFSPQPRHASRSSMMSEATFPRRQDATTATDLSYTPSNRNITPPSGVPILPYPALAQAQRASPSRAPSSAGYSSGSPSSLRMLQSSTPSSKHGFFASLGRKASISKKERSVPNTPASSVSSSRFLTKSPPVNPAPRAINIPSSPSVPGGPRAPPKRMLRSQTVIISSPFSSNQSSSERSMAANRSPSLHDVSSDTVLNIEADPEFVRQVDKLADLLPNAERHVLAGYLRRSGQDILAIGQYLEDEKMGTIRRD